MAGLPHNISSLLNNKTVSFLRRSNRRALDRIPDGEVSAALVRTAQAGNRNVDAAALTAATESIGGFPFMLQLVGYYAWDENPRASTLDSADFARGIAIAQQEMTYRVLDATFAELSPGDLRFAAAMLEDEGDSRIADLVERLGRSSSVVAQYRKPLIDTGIIGKRARGLVGSTSLLPRLLAGEARQRRTATRELGFRTPPPTAPACRWPRRLPGSAS